MRSLTLFIIYFSFISHSLSAKAQTVSRDKKHIEKLNKDIERLRKEREDIVLSDSLIQALSQKKLPRLVYEAIVEEQNEKTKNNVEDEKRLAQYREIDLLKGKRIAKIHIVPLQAWGALISDTTKTVRNEAERILNNTSRKTRSQTINRSLFVEEGELLDPERILDNERVLRTLPFIRDALILAEPSPTDTNEVYLTVMTKDVFPYGVSGSYSSLSKWTASVYNKNMFGQGHELELSYIHNAKADLSEGYDLQYEIHNFTGTYADFKIGYTQSYKQEGFNATLDRPFLRTDTKWGGSVKYYRYWNSDNLYDSPYDLNGFRINYSTFDSWVGYAFELPNGGMLGEKQLVVSGRYRKIDFFDRPLAGNDGNQVYANSNLILGSVSFANRYYIRDNLIRGFGATEDMPRGYFHELVVGYDDNEFIERCYAHLFLSTGDLVKYRSSYLYLSAGVGTFFNSRKMEQGEIQFQVNYISKQLRLLNRSMRYFVDLSYLNGINRFDQEYITINNDYGIRGFGSNEVNGQKRLALKTETEIYLKRKILGFSISTFSVLDIGIIGRKQEPIFTQDYYAGIGGGIRLRNDNLIFGTLQIRLMCYPKHPSDQSLFGFQFREGDVKIPYDFQPRMPQPLEYR
ncbi:MAG: hypothetical protein ACK5JS_01405 [Mangrovibacterium sp.]